MSCMSFKNEDDQPVTKITEEVLKKQGGTLEMIFQASPRVYSNFLGFLNDIMTFKWINMDLIRIIKAQNNFQMSKHIIKH